MDLIAQFIESCNLSELKSTVMTILLLGISIILAQVAYKLIVKCMYSSSESSVHNINSDKGSASYYKRRHEYRHSKRDSSDRFARANGYK